MKKITPCNTKKYKNQAGMNLTPPPRYYYYYYFSPPSAQSLYAAENYYD